MDKESVTRKAPDLARGDWILVADDVPAEVLLAVPGTDSGGPFVYLTYRYVGGAFESIEATIDRWFELASQERLDDLRKQAERVGQIANIRRLADWLEANPDVPMPYMVQASEHWDENPGDPDTSAAMATIRNLGQMYGIELDERLDDRTRFIVPFGKASYELVVWHKDGRPLVISDETIEQAGRMGSWNEREQRWEDPEPADPTGLAYSRPADGDEPQPAAGREPMHTGGVTEQGLVDETPQVSFADRLAAVLPDGDPLDDPGPCWHGDILPGRPCPGSGPDCGPA